MLTVYALVVLIILLFSCFVVFSFFKYRFQGDRTPIIIITYYAVVIVVIILTLSLLQPIGTSAVSAF